jgi:tRNA(fMet)-specific endonuclease VapC
VTLQEQLRGRLARCTAARTAEEYVEAAAGLRKTWDDYRRRLLLDFDDRAARRFSELKRAKVRIGTQDLRIAAVALANDATLITRNLAGFRKVPGLRAEDWTA